MTTCLNNGSEDAQAADDESSDSGGSVGPPTMGNGQEYWEDDAVVMPATHRGKERFDAWWWGWGVETWRHFLQAFDPFPCCLVRQFAWPAGFLMVVLSYN